MKAAFSNVEFPITAIEMFRSDRGAESTNHILKRELVAGGRFGSEEELRAALFDWANRHNNLRIHPTLGYMSPVEFREAGLILS